MANIDSATRKPIYCAWKFEEDKLYTLQRGSDSQDMPLEDYLRNAFGAKVTVFPNRIVHETTLTAAEALTDQLGQD